jgi:hypothetical protein
MGATWIGIIDSLGGSFTHWHGWEWKGWSALVALGTMGLALGTVWLAWTTRRAVKTSAAELIAGNRPVLTLVEDIMFGDGSNRLHLIGTEIAMSLENCGPGAALDTTISLDFDGNPPAPPERVGAAIAPGRLARVRWDTGSGAPFPRSATGLVEYSDIAGVGYETVFEISRHAAKGAVVVSQETRATRSRSRRRRSSWSH